MPKGVKDDGLRACDILEQSLGGPGTSPTVSVTTLPGETWPSMHPEPMPHLRGTEVSEKVSEVSEKVSGTVDWVLFWGGRVVETSTPTKKVSGTVVSQRNRRRPRRR